MAFFRRSGRQLDVPRSQRGPDSQPVPTSRRVPSCVEVCEAREVNPRKHKAVAFNISSDVRHWFNFDQTATDGVTVCFERLYGDKPVVKVECKRDREVFALLSHSGSTIEEVA